MRRCLLTLSVMVGEPTVKAHALYIMCPQRNLDSIVVVSAEVSEFDKILHHLSLVELPHIVNDRAAP